MEDFGKVAAATAALRYVSNNMVIGLGSGSTANIFIEKLAKRVKSEKMKIRCVATSISSKELGTKYGLNVVELDSVDRIDITIDGADEVDSTRSSPGKASISSPASRARPATSATDRKSVV